MGTFEEAQRAWAQQQHQVDPSQVAQSLDKTGDTFDTGLKIDKFDYSKEGFYQIRIWPRFEHPGPEFWLPVYFYGYQPSPSMPRGLSPKTFGQVDAFEAWVNDHFPYDKNSDITREWRSCLPGYRIWMLVQVRGMLNQNWQLVPLQDIDPNKLYLWDIPYHKQGFKDAIDPALRQVYAQLQGQNPIDLNNGYDAIFNVRGQKRERTINNFQFLTQNGPQVAGDPQTLAWIYENHYKSLSECSDVLTEDDVQKIIEYFEPIAMVSKKYPQRHQNPKDANSRAVCLNFLSSMEAAGGSPPPQAPGVQAGDFQPPQGGSYVPIQPTQQTPGQPGMPTTPGAPQGGPPTLSPPIGNPAESAGPPFTGEGMTGQPVQPQQPQPPVGPPVGPPPGITGPPPTPGGPPLGNPPPTSQPQQPPQGGPPPTPSGPPPIPQPQQPQQPPQGGPPPFQP